MNDQYVDPLLNKFRVEAPGIVEVTKMDSAQVSDVQKQLQILHENVWMLKDELVGLSLQLRPVRDTRPNPEPVRGVPKKDDYHCALAAIIMDEINTIYDCLNFVRELTKSLQI